MNLHVWTTCQSQYHFEDCRLDFLWIHFCILRRVSVHVQMRVLISSRQTIPCCSVHRFYGAFEINKHRLFEFISRTGFWWYPLLRCLSSQRGKPIAVHFLLNFTGRSKSCLCKKRHESRQNVTYRTWIPVEIFAYRSWNKNLKSGVSVDKHTTKNMHTTSDHWPQHH